MIIDGQETFDQGKIANCFNRFFSDIGLKLASMIPESQAKLGQSLNPYKTFMGEANLTDDELKEPLRSLKPNKNPNETSDAFFLPLKYIFNLFLQQGIFLKNLKDAMLSSIYKKDEEFLLINYKTISLD